MNHQKAFEASGMEMHPRSFWIASSQDSDYPALDRDIKVDVAVVGGGIAGITCAYILKQENLTVAVLDANHIVQRTTGNTTAKITSQHGLFYSSLINHVGRERAQQYADANEKAIRYIDELIRAKEIDCDFSRQSAYVYTQSPAFIRPIQTEVEAASSLGIKARYHEALPLPFAVKAAEEFENQAQFHPRKYLLALAREIPGNGSYIFEHSRVIAFHEGNPCTVTTHTGFTVTAEKLVIASHFPVYESKGFYFARMYPERSYALGARIKEKFPGGMYITAENPGRSLRSTQYEEGELLIVAGDRHKTGEGPDTREHYGNLAHFARENYEVIDVPFRWSSQDYTTLDKIPYIGNITAKSTNTYVATGFNKWGMSNGTAAAILIRDLIINGESPWAPVFNPSRFEADPMIKSFVHLGIHVAKHFIGDKLKPLPRDMPLHAGEAKIISHDRKKVGVFKDQTENIHGVHIVCSHMGCDLAWNAAEKSWDCPCHGSRFTFEGDIIEGPALKPLTTCED